MTDVIHSGGSGGMAGTSPTRARVGSWGRRSLMDEVAEEGLVGSGSGIRIGGTRVNREGEAEEGRAGEGQV